ncbi:hypothetical protein A3762_01150 [Oleiphilus sp. HI0125]|uniref:molybdenum cofactor guanylyltransferase n=2 Tax=Oleiphilus sp. HI0125 TaxID=1822266 RepID=UPI0007C248D2|nr:molybdenum cofactor guanylyltransferase [Oleiphilus sp. HI0125]KZZ57257.1 hypothetical protein A3762_01150 [Oleiphilus sp. HI0125]
MLNLQDIRQKLASLGTSCDAGVLSGGQSIRMGGEDKGLVNFLGKPLASYPSRLLSPLAQDHQTIISCNRNFDQYKQISQRICRDRYSEFFGPLAGIESLLSNSSSDVLFISPCDTPLVTSECFTVIANHIITQLESGTDLKPVALIQNNQKHPLHCCLPKSSLGSVMRAITSRHFKLIKWLEDEGVIWATGPSVCFDNANSLEDLALLER